MKKLEKDFFGVVIYSVVYMILTLITSYPRIAITMAAVDPLSIPQNFEFPLSIYSYGLLIICGFYSGLDFGLPTKFKLKSKVQKDVKRINVLFTAIMLSLILTESVILSIKYGTDFSTYVGDIEISINKVSLPLMEISVALVMTWCFFVTGSELSNEE